MRPAPSPPDPDTVPTQPSPGPVAQGPVEKASQHGKRALMVAAALGALVLAGLVVDGMRQPPKPAPAAAAEVPRPAAADPFADFEIKQRLEAARLEAERARALAQASRNLETTHPAAPPPALSTARSSEQELREAARLEDIKRALAALASREMVRTSATTASATTASATPAGEARSVAARTGDALPERVRDMAQAATAAPPAARPARAGAAPELPAFIRDLSGAAASGTVVGQSAAQRREGGQGQRNGERLVPTGTVMSAVLDMEINSDWEGRWRALITRDVYDLARDAVLIPKGTRVIGTSARPRPVNEAINERMALAAQWLVLPNGARVDLSRGSIVDGAGVAALEGDVNHHFLATVGGVTAYAVIGGLAAAKAVRAADGDPAAGLTAAAFGGRTAGAEIALGLAEVGKRVASRYLNLVPTITIQPGTPMNIFLDDEMFLVPWAPIDEFAPALRRPGPAHDGR